MSEGSETVRQFKFIQAAVSDIGLKREENQDSHGYAHTSHASVYLVADGMGGARGGGTASALAVNTIFRVIFDENGDVSQQTIREAIASANAVIFQQSQGDESLNGMGTTVVLLAFSREQLFVGHVGDSRAYRLRGGALDRLTRDHTLVQELVDSGAISVGEAHNHPIAHMLTRSLGPVNTVEPEVLLNSGGIKEFDRYLLCCDGVYNVVSDDRIAELLALPTPSESAQALLQSALDKGAPDNVTILVMEARKMDDASCEVSIPEPGKLRLVVSTEITDLPPIPPLDAPEEQETVTAEVEAKSSAAPTGQKKKKHNPLDDVIFQAGGNIIQEEEDEEEREREKEEEARAKEESENNESEHGGAGFEDETISLARLHIAGIAALLLIVAGFGMFIVFRRHGARTYQVAARPVATAPAVATESFSSVPTVAAEATLPVESEYTRPAPTEVPVATFPLGNTGWPSIEIAPSATPRSGEAKSEATVIPQPQFPEAQVTLARKFLVELEEYAPPRLPALKKNYIDGGPVEAIDWGAEQIAVKPQGASNKLFTEEEKAKLSMRKEELRESIVDIDMKLSALDTTTRAELDSRYRTVTERLDLAEKALDVVEADVRSARQEVSRWENIAKDAQELDVARIAAVIGREGDIALKLKEYEDATQSYQAKTEQWQSKQNDSQLVSELGALGRELKAKRSLLESAVSLVIESRRKGSKARLAEREYASRTLALHVNRIHRRLGFFEGVQPNVDDKNVPWIKNLLAEREKAIKELRDLQTQMSDEAERSYRRELAAKDVGSR